MNGKLITAVLLGAMVLACMVPVVASGNATAEEPRVLEIVAASDGPGNEDSSQTWDLYR